MKRCCASLARTSSSTIRRPAPRTSSAIWISSSIASADRAGRFLRTLERGGALFPIIPLEFAGAEDAERLGVTFPATQLRSSGAQPAQIGALLDDGTIRVVIDSTYPLADAARAHERAANGNLQGRLVLTVA